MMQEIHKELFSDSNFRCPIYPQFDNNWRKQTGLYLLHGSLGLQVGARCFITHVYCCLHSCSEIVVSEQQASQKIEQDNNTCRLAPGLLLFVSIYLLQKSIMLAASRHLYILGQYIHTKLCNQLFIVYNAPASLQLFTTLSQMKEKFKLQFSEVL